MFHRRGVPIILSSDAHAASEVGPGYDKSLQLVRDVGYREVVTFENRRARDRCRCDGGALSRQTPTCGPSTPVVLRLHGREVILDRTAFYPGGGGQPADKGTLGIGPYTRASWTSRRAGGDVVHVLDTAIPDTVAGAQGGAGLGPAVRPTCATTPPCTCSRA